MTPEQKIERLIRLIELTNEDYASKTEVVKLIQSVLDFLKRYKEEMDASIEDKTQRLVAQAEKAALALTQQNTMTRRELETWLSEQEARISTDTATTDKALTALREAVDGLRRSIPTVPSLEPLNARMDALEAAIPTVPDPLNGEDIRNFLEALPDGDKLAIDAIAGLKDLLDNLSTTTATLKSGGGGQLDVTHWPRHEEFTMNGSDTTVTLIQAPGAAGNAIFSCRYQGQVLDKDTHYTVDGNKITLVGFTPENGTIISITYMP